MPERDHHVNGIVQCSSYPEVCNPSSDPSTSRKDSLRERAEAIGACSLTAAMGHVTRYGQGGSDGAYRRDERNPPSRNPGLPHPMSSSARITARRNVAAT